MSLSRGILDAILPEGSLWSSEDDGDLDLLLEGIAANSDELVAFLGSLAHIRSPLFTPILDDLETEFGIVPDPSLSETTRRERLLSVKTAKDGDGSVAFLQQQLTAAGFNVQVYANDPAKDPSQFLASGASSAFGNEDALFGKTGALFGGSLGSLLVNGPLYFGQNLINYDTPSDPVYWPLVFFVGGDATRNEPPEVAPVICGNEVASCGNEQVVCLAEQELTGAIVDIAQATVPISRKPEFERIIVKYKPMFSWAAVVVRYT